VIDYLLVFVLTGLFAGGLWVARKLRPANLTSA
jgi:hypothetical protein